MKVTPEEREEIENAPQNREKLE
ncbi:hypothetical protein LCGC14_2863170, partial [marine sediment metagenome]